MEWWNEYLTQSEAVSLKDNKKVVPLEVTVNTDQTLKMFCWIISTFKVPSGSNRSFPLDVLNALYCHRPVSCVLVT